MIFYCRWVKSYINSKRTPEKTLFLWHNNYFWNQLPETSINQKIEENCQHYHATQRSVYLLVQLSKSLKTNTGFPLIRALIPCEICEIGRCISTMSYDKSKRDQPTTRTIHAMDSSYLCNKQDMEEVYL